MSKGMLIVVESDDTELKARIANLLAVQIHDVADSILRIGLPLNAHAQRLSFIAQDTEAAMDVYKGPFMSAALEAMERLYHRGLLHATLSNGQAVILDHYVSSTMLRFATQCSNDDIAQFIEWLHAYEYELNEMPQPAIVLYLDSRPIPGTERAEIQVVAKNAAQRDGWKWIDCEHRTDSDIVYELCSYISDTLKKETVT